MKRINRMLRYVILALCLVLGASPLRAETQPNPMHPAFQLLDAQGKVTGPEGKGADQVRTCGQCHAAAFITGHSLPGHQPILSDCLSCHFQGGKVDWGSVALEPNGMVKRQWLRISKPSGANCSGCHGLAAAPGSPVSIPEDYRAAAYPQGRPELERHRLSRAGGTIFSPQDLAASFLNLAGKQGLHFPWDVHARKLVQCTDCHYAPNNPQRLGSQAATVAGLRAEPRRETVSEYLKQPDHRLITASCQTCHDPRVGHGFLPYPERHLEVVACESCHIPRQMGPAERMVDATLLDESGSPMVEYHGTKGEPANLNTAYTGGFLPPLLPLPQSGKSGAGMSLTPVNPVSRWYWAAGDSREPISREILQQALMLNGQYRPEVIAALDTNHDGRMERGELKLDNESKRKTVERLLTAAGIRNPVIRAEVNLHRISHGVAERGRALSDCGACHGPGSRIKDSIVLASHTPGDIPPTWKDKPLVSGRIDTEAGGRVVWNLESGRRQDLHVFGMTSRNWPDRLGFLMLMGVVLAVALHAGYRLVRRRRRAHAAVVYRREYLFTAYERVWHWVMALSVLVLMATGFQIHFPGGVRLFSAANAVAIHNFFAVVLALNAFLALFYHLATAAIRQFLPSRRGMAEGIARQAKYYLLDIFQGLPAPFSRSPEHKLNVLQQVTYLGLLNVMFPFQMITGAMIWLVGQWPAFAAAVGGLGVIAPLHNLGSWMFISFLVAHVYLITTGHTVFSHLRGMIEGYEEVEVTAVGEGERI